MATRFHELSFFDSSKEIAIAESGVLRKYDGRKIYNIRPNREKIEFSSDGADGVSWEGAVATVSHHLNCYPFVIVLDEADRIIDPIVTIKDANTIAIDFSSILMPDEIICVLTYGAEYDGASAAVSSTVGSDGFVVLKQMPNAAGNSALCVLYVGNSIEGSYQKYHLYKLSESDGSYFYEDMGSFPSGISEHENNTDIHVTAEDKARWDSSGGGTSDFSGDYNDLENKPSIPSKISDLTNDSSFITSSSLEGYAQESFVYSSISSAVSSKANSSDLTSHIGNTTVHITSSERSSWNAKSEFSGSYNDLTNKPTIPSNNNQLTNGAGYQTASQVSNAITSAVSSKANLSDLTTHTGNTTVHITDAERTSWNTVTNKANSSDLASHAGDTTAHITSTERTTWNTVTSKASASDLTSHTGNTTVHITSTERTTWNAKQNAITSSNKLSYSLLSDPPSIPSKVSELNNDSGYITATALSPYKTLLTSYTTLTGTSVTVQPGKEYKWTLTGNSTLNISGGESGKVGECRIEITNNGTYILTGGTGVTLRQSIQTHAVNYYTVRFMGTSARAYIFDVDEL